MDPAGGVVMRSYERVRRASQRPVGAIHDPRSHKPTFSLLLSRLYPYDLTRRLRPSHEAGRTLLARTFGV